MIICADDYGMREDIDRAILELCERGRLSAVSCMVLFERCDRSSMERLRKHEAKVDLGLHLTLTPENFALSAPLQEGQLQQFRKLLERAIFRRLKPAEVRPLLEAQYHLFVEKSGRSPDYIDGHLHAHQLPVIAETLVEFVRQLPPGKRPYVRNTRLSTTELRRKKLPWLKAGIIGQFGAELETQLKSAGLPTNSGFSGIYNFRYWRSYPELLSKFASCLPDDNGILVTHPGFEENWRRSEWEAVKKADLPINRFHR